MRGAGRRGAGPGPAAGLWVLLMAAWLGGLLLGLRQAWPVFRDPAPVPDIAAAAMWLIIGFAAWTAALNLGLRRYWRR
jgi:hypothetical protein